MSEGSPNIIADKWQYFMGFYLGTKVSRALAGERATTQLPTELRAPKRNMCAQHVPLSLCPSPRFPAPLHPCTNSLSVNKQLTFDITNCGCNFATAATAAVGTVGNVIN